MLYGLFDANVKLMEMCMDTVRISNAVHKYLESKIAYYTYRRFSYEVRCEYNSRVGPRVAETGKYDIWEENGDLRVVFVPTEESQRILREFVKTYHVPTLLEI